MSMPISSDTLLIFTNTTTNTADVAVSSVSNIRISGVTIIQSLDFSSWDKYKKVHFGFNKDTYNDNASNLPVINSKYYNYYYNFFEDMFSICYIELHDDCRIFDFLEMMFHIFNIQKPEDFNGHSMSSSDVIKVLFSNGTEKYYIVCSIGFKEINFVNDDNGAIPVI